MNKQNKPSLAYKFVKSMVRLCYPRLELIGLENIPDEPCAIVGNHAQLHGPISCELFLSDDCYIWCAAPMMNLKEVPAYAYEDFWSQKPKYVQSFFKLASYLIAPLSVLIFNHARTIPVYRDNRILNTFRESVSLLQNHKNVIIFPEHDQKNNNILYEFQKGFVDIARTYYKRTGKELSFVPLYIAPNLKKMYFGKPVTFSSDAPIKEERERICNYLTNEITRIARDLPVHIVIPYRNIPKRMYPKNKQEEQHL